MDSYQAELRDVTEMTPSVKHFLFELDKSWSFKPGQHTVFDLSIGGETVKRPYTMTNVDGSNSFTVAVKKYDDGTGSVKMHSLSIGDTVTVNEPKGNLYLRDTRDDAVFVSTGTGASPMIAMLQAYLEDGDGHAYYLHGERTMESRLFTESLVMLEAEHDGLTVVHSLSDDDWDGRTGRIQSHLPSVVDELSAATHYVCGVPQMVVDTESFLENHGVPSDQIVAEGWEDDAT